MLFRPVQHPLNLWPVGNIIEINQPQRRTGDNQAVKVIVSDIVEVAVKVVQMLAWRVARLTAVDA
ncbi:hypothetical protein E05_25140 [Plautia stali symbiont]|nr:hypothetical protein E05_25140 [Plautia stali symbiont]